MPSKTSKTTRKHGTVTKINLYAADRRCLATAADVLTDLADMTDDDTDRAQMKDAVKIIASAALIYANYESNGQPRLPLEDDND